MLDVEPHRTLRYMWRVPFAGGALDTVVTFTLTPTPSGTRLSVVRSGFTPEQRRECGGARYGWTAMGGRLADLLARTACVGARTRGCARPTAGCPSPSRRPWSPTPGYAGLASGASGTAAPAPSARRIAATSTARASRQSVPFSPGSRWRSW